MSSTFYSTKSDTLTVRNILDAFRSAYLSVYDTPPEECEHVEGIWFRINGEMHERKWVLLEIERLRQEGIVNTLQKENLGSRKSIFKALRHLSRL